MLARRTQEIPEVACPLVLGSQSTECSIHFILSAQGFSHTISGHFRVILVLLAFTAISQSPQKLLVVA